MTTTSQPHAPTHGDAFRPARPARPPSLKLSPHEHARRTSVAESFFSSSTTTFDNYARISQFPQPPSTLPTASLHSQPSAYSYRSPYSGPSPHSSNFRSLHSSHPSHGSSAVSNSASAHEEVLEEAFIANLLASRGTRDSHGTQAWFDENLNSVSEPGPQTSGSAKWGKEPRCGQVPASPTMSTGTSGAASSLYPPPSRPPSTPTPPVPSLPSPLLRQIFPRHAPPSGNSNSAVIDSSESRKSQISLATSGVSHPSSSDLVVSRAATTVCTSPPLSIGATPLGFARAAYLPKDSATSPRSPSLSPISVPRVFSPNLIDLSSPRSSSRSPLNPNHPLHESIVLPALPESVASPRSSTLSPPAYITMPPRSRTSSMLSPTLSPRHEAPSNVPVDVESEMEPSTTVYQHYKSHSRSRLSMSSLVSRFSRSTHSSGRHRAGPSWATWRRADAPPLPPVRDQKRPMDRQEVEKLEQGMALPALANRASVLQQMLERGHLPRGSMSTSGSVLPADAPAHAANATWENYTAPGYVDESALKRKKSQSIRSFFSRTTRTTTDRHAGHFNPLDEELQRRYQEQIAANFSSSSLATATPPGTGARSWLSQFTNHTPENEKVPSPSPLGGSSSASVSGSGFGIAAQIDSQAALQASRRVTIIDPGRPLRSPEPPTPTRFGMNRLQRQAVYGALMILLGIIIAIGLAVGLVMRRNKGDSSTLSSGTGDHCGSGNFTGVNCDLDATCVCTGTGTGRCNPLASSIMSLVDQTNTFFNATFNASSVALVFWDVQGAPPSGSTCALQAKIVDVAPGLTKDVDAKRAAWAKSAILWSLMMSEDQNGVEDLRSFVAGNNYAALTSSKSPGAGGDKYKKTSDGFVFDFNAMQVAPVPAKWKDVATPPQAQIDRLGDGGMEGVLDRMYTSSIALSTQATLKLTHYWGHVLGLSSDQLTKFTAAVRSAPVLLPFDITASGYSGLMQGTNRTTSFPPPQACSPLMTTSRLGNVLAVEAQAFGLTTPSTSVPSSFNEACFASHSVYGVLDILRLRTPFLDSRKGLAKQAVVLGADAASRLVVRSGEGLAAYPSTPAQSDLSVDALNPGKYGTMDHLNHVLLNWLQSMPAAQAAALATLVISAATTGTPPPAEVFGTSAGTAVDLTDVPLLEVSLMGTVGLNSGDVKYVMSSLAEPDGSTLFFGSNDSNVLRQWASSFATSPDGTLVQWAELAVSQAVVNESRNPESNDAFMGVWNQATSLVSSGGSSGGVSTVVLAFAKTGLLPPP